MAAPAVPAGLGLGEVLAAALPWIASMTCLGLLWVYRRSLKRLILKFADLIDVDISIHGIGGHPLGGVAKWLRAQAENIDTLLGAAVTACDHASSVLFKLGINTLRWTATEIADLATDAWKAVRSVEHTTVNRITKVVTHTVVKPLTKTVTVVKGTSTAVARQLTARVKALEHRVTSIAHTTAGAIAAPFPRLGRLEKGAKSQAARIGRLEKSVIGTVAAGFGVAVLAKALIGWLRCPSVSRAMRKRQCIDFDFLDALLTGALLIVGTISLVEFAKEVEGITEEASGLIHGFLRDA